MLVFYACFELKALYLLKRPHMWSVRKSDFDESVKGGWWRKLVVAKKNVGDGEEDLHF